MIKYNPKNWLGLIFHTYSRQVVKTLMPALLIMGAYTGIVTFLLEDYFKLEFNSTTVVHSLLGIVLGLFLVFRVNSAYDRWYEGRKLWGLLLNNSRNLASKINAFIPKENDKDRAFFKGLIPAFAFALRDHLRKGIKPKHLKLVDEEILHELTKKEHIPNAITSLMYQKLNKLLTENKLSPHQFFVLDKEMKEFSDILGGCERIKNTPIPYSYSMFIKKFIFTYTITLPLAFITEFHYMTIPIVLFIFFILISVELIAEEIEEPFGGDVNDLPTGELSEKIETNVKELFD
ncbi:bestrophin family ion channel [Marivirga harenae]|uniref:bestrophin family protein n=1 Tax=Marivirga harenae TaxID=2010992 RepID=UPI0026DFA7C4|nr:bestrophin family ion channel [Marivirga harenae]WKV11229.1 bestrophin family ion channel [Marivirga harenae]|tara:strand:- start:110116 stop:110985 length:870 start_codon:yes stop_codon:yes gene_type:complete